jgi:hypothetical protein
MALFYAQNEEAARKSSRLGSLISLKFQEELKAMPNWLQIALMLEAAGISEPEATPDSPAAAGAGALAGTVAGRTPA